MYKTVVLRTLFFSLCLVLSPQEDLFYLQSMQLHVKLKKKCVFEQIFQIPKFFKILKISVEHQNNQRVLNLFDFKQSYYF
jgi:hypothetical protein